MEKVQFSYLKYTKKSTFSRARLNDRENIFFCKVQLLRSIDEFSGCKAPEKINLGNNCRPSIHILGLFARHKFIINIIMNYFRF